MCGQPFDRGKQRRENTKWYTWFGWFLLVSSLSEELSIFARFIHLLAVVLRQSSIGIFWLSLQMLSLWPSPKGNRVHCHIKELWCEFSSGPEKALNCCVNFVSMSCKTSSFPQKGIYSTECIHFAATGLIPFHIMSLSGKVNWLAAG